MNIQSILAEVERQVAERLPAVLFDKGIVLHAKKSFKQGCDCDYCNIKREATFRIGNLPVKFIGDHEEKREYKKQIRNKLRVAYRVKLKSALNDIN